MFYYFFILFKKTEIFIYKFNINNIFKFDNKK